MSPIQDLMPIPAMHMDRNSIAVRIAVAFGLALLLSACLKDGVMPTPKKEEGPVELAMEMVVGSEPFHLHHAYQDWAGNTVRFTTLKCYISGIRLQDDDSTLVANLSAAVVLLDGQSPSSRHQLGRMSNGHVHSIEFTGGLATDEQLHGAYGPGHVLSDPSMACPDGGGRIHLLMEGYLDRDGDGAFDPAVDLAFSYRPSGPEAARGRHLHLHADMVGGELLTLRMRLDVRFILLGIDLAEQPLASGNDPKALAALANLAAGVYPWY